MLSSSEIRNVFLDFFRSKQHQVVPSAPLVIKNDPTLMFTNAGMNQFKDIFLGNQPAKYKRIADTQKCLRVSGKHNDLEDVGMDTYHHTMFEMLGNWSFGDYFKKEAIEWAWELLTDRYKISKDNLYVTVFEGDKNENLAFDSDAFNFWKQWISEDRILRGNKKDNFWEMGDSGPCGPCSEIHVDLRPEDEKKKIPGKELVNKSHPQVIEIWNLVFIEFNRKADGSLESLPAKHVDTGMGFERLCMVLQGKISNYDTDVFQPMIFFIAQESKKKYGEDVKSDIAMRVLADHIRAISFAIADGQLPSNNKAGYVIRRILRRAVRYGYTFLNFKEPFLNKLVPILAEQFKDVFPELKAQEHFVQKVVMEEEASFLRTLATGIQKFEAFISGDPISNNIPGNFAFELYDTYGFPIDLTQLMARERNFTVDMVGFNKCMEEQKNRSRAATAVDTDDWKIIKQEDGEAVFVGYEQIETKSGIVKYRKIKTKGKEQYQIVLDHTPFYAESGGQVGDTGFLEIDGEKIFITDTQKENDLIIHISDKLPSDLSKGVKAVVDINKRRLTENNHSATHLLHAALKQVLGNHVAQKGSLVNEEHLRFDFSHFAKLTEEELEKIEDIVSRKIAENIPLVEKRNVPIEEAKKLGAMALFGEKYGEFVRVITFDKNFSIELCGGTHVPTTGVIRKFKIVSESAVAAGVRRIEAITADKAEEYFSKQVDELNAIRKLMGITISGDQNVAEQIKELDEIKKALKHPKDAVKAIQSLQFENESLKNNSVKTPFMASHISNTLKAVLLLLEENAALKKIEAAATGERILVYKTELKNKIKVRSDINFLAEQVNLPSADAVKTLSFGIKQEVQNLFLVLAAEIDGKAQIAVTISENLVKDKMLDASKIVRELAKEIEGGGGGQPFFATAGGKNPGGIARVLEKSQTYCT